MTLYYIEQGGRCTGLTGGSYLPLKQKLAYFDPKNFQIYG